MEQFTEEQWKRIENYLPKKKRSEQGGRPRVKDRSCMEEILWVLRSKAMWKNMPSRYPSPATCWQRLHPWEGNGGMTKDVAYIFKRIG